MYISLFAFSESESFEHLSVRVEICLDRFLDCQLSFDFFTFPAQLADFFHFAVDQRRLWTPATTVTTAGDTQVVKAR